MTDYDRIARAISFIVHCVNCQPTLDEIAAHVHVSPFHFQRLFSRWAGVTPKRFLQVLTVDRAKQLLKESKSILEVSDTLGLSSGSRLYDHFVHLEATTPGEFKHRGAGLTIEHAVHHTPFGDAFIAMTQRGICSLGFLDHEGIAGQLTRLRKQWPEAELQENRKKTSSAIRAIFSRNYELDRPLSLYVSGTNFQTNVWKALLQIPPGMVTTYSQVAEAMGHPRSARAVGTAVGSNPVAFLIPCHRVIHKNGRLGEYHWGETRKQAIHVWETAHL